VQAYGAAASDIVVGSELGRIDIDQTSATPAIGILFVAEQGDIEITSIHNTVFNGNTGISVAGNQGVLLRSQQTLGTGYSATYAGPLTATSEGGLTMTAAATLRLQSNLAMTYSATGDNIFLESLLDMNINSNAIVFDSGFVNNNKAQLSRGTLTIQSQNTLAANSIQPQIVFTAPSITMTQTAKLLIPSIDQQIPLPGSSRQCFVPGEVVIAPNNVNNVPPNLAYPYLCVCNGYLGAAGLNAPANWAYVCTLLRDWK